MKITDRRIAATKTDLQAHVLAAAKDHPSNADMTLNDVIILDKGDGDWTAAFSNEGPELAEYALLAVPRVQSKYRLTD